MKMNFKLIGKYFVGAMLLSGVMFTACKDDDDDDGDDGKVDPSKIASTNLIHYWDFENSPVDKIGSKGTVTGNVTYVAGRRGMAYKGAENAYISWDVAPTDKIAVLKGFTIASWIKAPKVDGGPPMIFQITGTEFLGSFAFFQENNGNNTSDSIAFKTFFSKQGAKDKNGNPGWVGHDWVKSKKEFVADFWLHIVTNYDPATSKTKVYVNGNYLFTATGAYGDEVRYQGDPGAVGNPNGQPLLGDLKLSLLTSGNKGIIGSWANKRFGTALDTWMKDYMGLIDELRVYDKALTDKEVKDLYDAEVSQLNE